MKIPGENKDITGGDEIEGDGTGEALPPIEEKVSTEGMTTIESGLGVQVIRGTPEPE